MIMRSVGREGVVEKHDCLSHLSGQYACLFDAPPNLAEVYKKLKRADQADSQPHSCKL